MQAERAWLRWVQAAAAAGPLRPELRAGIGDDAALLRPRRGWELAITTDLFVEGVHFLRARDLPASCGARVAARALSDLAAMGAQPLGLLISLALPPPLPAAWTRSFYRGLLRAAAEAGARLAGGDVSASPVDTILIDVVGVGQAPQGRALRRGGARPGDLIFVSGALGLAARGRELVHGGAPPSNATPRTAAPPRTSEDRRAMARHRRPRARWELGLALRGIAASAIDLSDGLSTDLAHLCEASGCGAELDAERIPRLDRPDGLTRALRGGEDYELLFTVPPSRLKRLAPLRKRFELAEVGRITAQKGLWLRSAAARRARVLPTGWQHFA